MNWDYFIEDGRFKARRFPNSKSPVKIKDCTDLQDIRSELRGLSSVEECIEAYEFYFNDQEWYEVEVETFEELFERGSKELLKGVDKLKGNFGLIQELMDWELDEREEEWIFIDERLGKQLLNNEIIETSKEINDDLWVEFLCFKYTVNEMKKIGEEQAIELKGPKYKMATQLLHAIQTRKLKHKKPFPARPHKNLEKWFKLIQEKYVSEVEKSLSSFNYPPLFMAAVWNMVSTDNDEFEGVISVVDHKYGNILPKENELSSVKIDSPNENSSFGVIFAVSTLFIVASVVMFIVWK